MKMGHTGKILSIDASSGKNETIEKDDDFYRTYPGGGSIGTWFLVNKRGAKAGPCSPENIFVIAASITTGAPVSGVSRCTVTAISPLTGTIADSQAGGNFGPFMKQAGFDAVVIKGRFSKPSYLYIEDGTVTVHDASGLAGSGVPEVHDRLTEIHGEKNVSILQCGPAGEKLVRFANIMSDLNDVFGRAGLGAVLGSKNLRAVVVKGGSKLSFNNADGLKALNKLSAERLPGSDFPSVLTQYGTPGVVRFQAEAGNFATHNYSRGFHVQYKQLDGSVYKDKFKHGKKTCFGCVVGCRKTVSADGPYTVTDKMGGPEFETLALLGANLDITDPATVARANELCNFYGIDTITMGCVAGYMFECVEKGLVSIAAVDNKKLKFGDPEGLFWLIEQTALRKGIGDTAAEGFTALIEKFGPDTESCAVHVKGEGLPVHMPQVKPSLALMYSVCPIGPDHMSSEHDWLLASGSEESKGLGILGRDPATSTGTNKVRMTAYSQIYYSLLDTLSLCMFCWGPGNLFTYRDLEDLVQYTTGWSMTFWELMKAGERRITMMKQVNVMRGFSSSDDILPRRLFDPLPDGPSEGRQVDKNDLDRMKKDYYEMMGWDAQSGSPEQGKLNELGLQWMLELD